MFGSSKILNYRVTLPNLLYIFSNVTLYSRFWQVVCTILGDNFKKIAIISKNV